MVAVAYKGGLGFENETNELEQIKLALRRDLNSGTSDYKSNALTARPRCLPQPKELIAESKCVHSPPRKRPLQGA